MNLAAAALGGVSLRSLRVWQRNRDVFMRLWRAELVPPLIEPIFFILAIGLGLGAYVNLDGQQDYIQFLVPGMLAIFPMFAAVGECLWGAYFRMARQGTYQAIISTPVSVEDLTGGEILWGATRMVISTTFLLLIVAIFSPVYDLYRSPLILLVPPLSLAAGIVFAATTLSYTAVAPSISSLNYFFTLFITPTFWFGGAFFPPDKLPAALRVVAWFIPTTHIVNVYRGLVDGVPQWSQLGDLAWLAVVGLAFTNLAVVNMRRRLIK